MKKVAIGIVALVAIFLLIGAVLPSAYQMERSIVVNTSPEVVFAQVHDLKKWPNWSPWHAADPTLTPTYGPKTIGVGASYSWTSEDMGDGSLEVIEVVPNRSIRNALDFQQEGTAFGTWKFEPTSEGTKVTWGLEGESEGIIDKYFALMIDAMVGSMFEDGLNKLKEVAEKDGRS